MEQIADVMLRAKPKKGMYDLPENPVYHCVKCKRVVAYPDILYQDGLCEGCHKAALTHG